MAVIPRYSATVIGAGPAGLAVVATLLDAGTDSILWADPNFEAGRLSSYKEVPSNTKVGLFSQYALVSPTLSSVATSALVPLQVQL
jgi:cation diffusion facilitator CzcD-associated flavoprotein CzcO